MTKLENKEFLDDLGVEIFSEELLKSVINKYCEEYSRTKITELIYTGKYTIDYYNTMTCINIINRSTFDFNKYSEIDDKCKLRKLIVKHQSSIINIDWKFIIIHNNDSRYFKGANNIHSNIKAVCSHPFNGFTKEYDSLFRSDYNNDLFEAIFTHISRIDSEVYSEMTQIHNAIYGLKLVEELKNFL